VLNVRKVVVYELLSLDGVAEKPDGFFADWDDAMEANLGAVIAAQDSVILGRRSYEEWAELWPGSDIEPFATFINGVAKYVATSTPLDRKWANTTVVDGELVEFVRDLRSQPGADIGVDGAATPVSTSRPHLSSRASSPCPEGTRVKAVQAPILAWRQIALERRWSHEQHQRPEMPDKR
jgi:dihydrofolate reductase